MEELLLFLGLAGPCASGLLQILVHQVVNRFGLFGFLLLLTLLCLA